MHPEEWRSLKGLRLRALETDPDSFASSLTEERAMPDAAWRAWASEEEQVTLVAVEGDVWVGMAVCVMDEAAPRSAKAYAMWVDPPARRQGVGQGLLDALTEWACRQAPRNCF